MNAHQDFYERADGSGSDDGHLSLLQTASITKILVTGLSLGALHVITGKPFSYEIFLRSRIYFIQGLITLVH